VEQLAIQQQIELLQQQQQQIQATHQQYVNMGMIPPTQHLAPGGGYPIQQQMQPNFQFPNQMQQQQPDEPSDGCSYTTVITSP
jgi:protein SSD1